MLTGLKWLDMKFGKNLEGNGDRIWMDQMLDRLLHFPQYWYLPYAFEV